MGLVALVTLDLMTEMEEGFVFAGEVILEAVLDADFGLADVEDCLETCLGEAFFFPSSFDLMIDDSGLTTEFPGLAALTFVFFFLTDLLSVDPTEDLRFSGDFLAAAVDAVTVAIAVAAAVDIVLGFARFGIEEADAAGAATGNGFGGIEGDLMGHEDGNLTLLLTLGLRNRLRDSCVPLLCVVYAVHATYFTSHITASHHVCSSCCILSRVTFFGPLSHKGGEMRENSC